jgi:hypothetical protein
VKFSKTSAAWADFITVQQEEHVKQRRRGKQAASHSGRNAHYLADGVLYGLILPSTSQLGICKRMLKEVAAYEKEVQTNEARVQKMKDDGKDPYGKFGATLLMNLCLYCDSTSPQTFVSRKRCSKKAT